MSAVVHRLYAVQEVDADPFAIPPAPFRFVCGSTDRRPTRPLPAPLMVATDPLMRSTTVRRERWNDSVTATYPLHEIR